MHFARYADYLNNKILLTRTPGVTGLNFIGFALNFPIGEMYVSRLKY